MKRMLIWIPCLAAVAGLAWAQRGHGGGAAGPQGGPPQFSGPANSSAAARSAGPRATAGPKASAMDVGARVASNPALSARLGPLLPAGMNLQTAAEGFRNQGQFVAALHVSKNLNIPFADLKTAMTGASPLSLGKAIQQLRPDLGKKTVDAEVKQAESEAKQDVSGSK